jgi:hypothetical protein
MLNVASSLASDELQFLRILLSEFGYELPPTLCYVHTSAAVTILQIGPVDAKTKYLAVHWHCVRKRLYFRIIGVSWVRTGGNVAYMFPQPVDPQTFSRCRSAVHLIMRTD